jgi:hypothetical protein
MSIAFPRFFAQWPVIDELIHRCGGSDGIAVGAPSSRLNAQRGIALRHLTFRLQFA